MRKATVAVLLGLIVAAAGAAAWEFQYNDAAMKVAFYSNSLGDPAPVSRKDTKAAFQVEAEAAKTMFDALPKNQKDPCGAQPDTEYRASVNGLLVCTKASKEAPVCSFGVDVNRGKLVAGSIC